MELGGEGALPELGGEGALPEVGGERALPELGEEGVVGEGALPELGGEGMGPKQSKVRKRDKGQIKCINVYELCINLLSPVQ